MSGINALKRGVARWYPIKSDSLYSSSMTWWCIFLLEIQNRGQGLNKDTTLVSHSSSVWICPKTHTFRFIHKHYSTEILSDIPRGEITLQWPRCQHLCSCAAICIISFSDQTIDLLQSQAGYVEIQRSSVSEPFHPYTRTQIKNNNSKHTQR